MIRFPRARCGGDAVSRPRRAEGDAHLSLPGADLRREHEALRVGSLLKKCGTGASSVRATARGCCATLAYDEDQGSAEPQPGCFNRLSGIPAGSRDTFPIWDAGAHDLIDSPALSYSCFS